MEIRQVKQAGSRVFCAAVMWLVLAPELARAVPLGDRITGLFGGTLNTTIQPGVSDPGAAETQHLRFASQFRSLSAALAAARSQAPVPSASGAFRFAWDADVDTFVRLPQSLGSGLAERAPTLGRHTGFVSMSYTHVDFDTLEGDPLDHLTFTQSAFSDSFLQRLPTEEERQFFAQDVLHTQLDVALTFDIFFVTAAYGLTDRLDVSLALSLNRARMRGGAQVDVLPNEPGHSVFLTDANGDLAAPSGRFCNETSLRCAVDDFDDSAFGTGDIFLRAKWHLYDWTYADLAVAGVLTVPTGNADDFLGFHDPTFTPWMIASKTLGRVSPHVNLGYSFRSGADVSQGQWIAGADFLASKWLTLAADFVGFHDDKRDGANDDVLQSAVGFKLNPFGNAVLGAGFQFPLNRDGLRADVIYTGQVEYTF